MKNKPMTLKRLAGLLNKCIEDGVSISFLTDPDQPSPSWDDTIRIALNAYHQAIVDVSGAIEGDPTHLEELLAENGRAAILDPKLEHPFVWVPEEDIKDARELGFTKE